MDAAFIAIRTIDNKLSGNKIFKQQNVEQWIGSIISFFSFLNDAMSIRLWTGWNVSIQPKEHAFLIMLKTVLFVCPIYMRKLCTQRDGILFVIVIHIVYTSSILRSIFSMLFSYHRSVSNKSRQNRQFFCCWNVILSNMFVLLAFIYSTKKVFWSFAVEIWKFAFIAQVCGICRAPYTENTHTICSNLNLIIFCLVVQW